VVGFASRYFSVMVERERAERGKKLFYCQKGLSLFPHVSTYRYLATLALMLLFLNRGNILEYFL